MAVAKVMKKDTDKVRPLGPLGCRWARWACCTHAGCRAGLWARWAGCRWAWCGTPSLHAAAGSAGGAPVLCNHGIASAPPPWSAEHVHQEALEVRALLALSSPF